MFVVVAQSMNAEEYGKFAVAFSLVLVLSKFGAAGQQDLMLKLLPPYTRLEDKPFWRGAVVFALLNTTAACALAAISLLIWKTLFSKGSNELYVLAALPLAVMLAFSELQTCLIRVEGRMALALAPRELAWRLSVIGFCSIAIFSGYSELDAVTVLLFSAITLAAILLLQATKAESTRYSRSLRGKREYLPANWAVQSLNFWVASLVVFATPNISVVLVGTLTETTQAGSFFSALRTAQLMGVVLLAANLAAAPLIAKFHANADHASVKRICRLVSISSSTFAAAGIIIILFGGEWLLSLFGELAKNTYYELVVLSVGFGAVTIFGPVGPLLAMAGMEKYFALVLLLVNSTALALLVPFTNMFGTMGAALTVAASNIAWGIIAWRICIIKLKIDPSIFGFISRTRL